MQKRRRTPQEQIDALRAAKARAEAALARVLARAKEAERAAGLRRRAILAVHAAALFDEKSPEGEVFRALLAQRVKQPRHRAMLGLVPF